MSKTSRKPPENFSLLALPIEQLRQLGVRALRDLAVCALAPEPSWEKDRRPPIYFEEWVYLAGYHPNQDLTWRTHEFRARERYVVEQDADLGGEA